MSLDPTAWEAIGVGVSAIAAALGAIAVARIQATKNVVGEAKQAASDANDAAIEARDLSRPVGNGYADESRRAWARIESKVDAINQGLMQHLQDHAASDLDRH